MRSGEDIEDIISKRGITREEVDALNPDVNLDRLTGRTTRTLAGLWNECCEALRWVLRATVSHAGAPQSGGSQA